MTKQLVSIIVPIFNIEDCLSRCIESLMAQTYDNIEILLVNDGSSDNSAEIAEAYAHKDKRIHFYNKSNGGLSSARNFGLEKAKGEYICFVDGDDFVDPRMVEILHKEIETHHVKLACCGFRVYHDGDKIYKDSFDPKKTEVFNTEEAMNHLFTKEKYANYAWNKMYHHSLWSSVRFPLGRKMEDLGCMYLIVAQCDAVSFNPVKLCNYYQRGSSILHNRDKKFYDDKFTLTYERYQYLKEHYPNMLRNELYMMVIIMDAYPHMEPGSQQKKLAESLMKQFPASHSKHFPPRYQKRYRYYRFSKALYRHIYKKKSDKE